MEKMKIFFQAITEESTITKKLEDDYGAWAKTGVEIISRHVDLLAGINDVGVAFHTHVLTVFYRDKE